MVDFKRKIIKILPFILMITLIIISGLFVQKELDQYSIKDIINSLNKVSQPRKTIAIFLTILGYLVMTGYDYLGFHYIRRRLAISKIVLTSFISYAVGNTIGLTIFSGTAIRYRFYKVYGVSNLEIAKIIFFTHLSFWLAILTIGGIVLLIYPFSASELVSLHFTSVHSIGMLFLILVSIYFLFSFFPKNYLKIFHEKFKFPSSQISLIAILITLLDWSIASEVLYLLLPADESLSYLGFFGIYIIALTAGILSTVPGGLGVFETVILLLRPPSMSASDIFGSLIVYRGIYYLLPLFVAILLLMIYEVKNNYKKFLK